MEQRTLFDDDRGCPGEGGPDIAVHRAAISQDLANRQFEGLRADVGWKQDFIRMYGTVVPVPRLAAWVGDPGTDYLYSGIAMKPGPWSPVVQQVRAMVEPLASTRFNSVLCNLYRDGQDGLAWHSDDEAELGPEPVIASANFGATRRFLLRRKDDHAVKIELNLRGGDVLIMRGITQSLWEHSVPKTSKPRGERINLTFRTMLGLPRLS